MLLDITLFEKELFKELDEWKDQVVYLLGFAELYFKMEMIHRAEEALEKVGEIINLVDDVDLRSIGLGILVSTASRIGLDKFAKRYAPAILPRQFASKKGAYVSILKTLLQENNFGEIEEILNSVNEELRASLLAHLALFSDEYEPATVELYFGRAVELCKRYRKYDELAMMSRIFVKTGRINEYIRIASKATCPDRYKFMEILKYMSASEVLEFLEEFKDLAHCGDRISRSRNMLHLAKRLAEKDLIKEAENIREFIDEELFEEECMVDIIAHERDVGRALEKIATLKIPEARAKAYMALLERHPEEQERILDASYMFITGISCIQAKLSISLFFAERLYEMKIEDAIRFYKFATGMLSHANERERNKMARLAALLNQKEDLELLLNEMHDLEEQTAIAVCKFYLETLPSDRLLEKLRTNRKLIAMLPVAAAELIKN